MTKQAVTVLVTLAMFVTGCGQNAGNITVTDSSLKEDIETKVNSDAELKAANLSITADAARNAATISGTVESQDLRTKAVELAKGAHAELVVEDNIVVKPRELTRAEFTQEHARQERERAKERKERIGNSINDAWIHATIVTRLIGGANTREERINVDVNNGVVTLRGAVDSAGSKAEAEQISKGAEGVKRVNNLLKVAKGS